MQFFQRVYDQMPYATVGTAIALAAIVLLLGYDWLARRRENERDAEARADAEWDEQVRTKLAGAAKPFDMRPGAVNRVEFAPNARLVPPPPDVEPVSRETRKAPRRKNTRRKVRHK